MRETVIVYGAVAIDLILIQAITVVICWSLGSTPSYQNFINTVVIIAFIRIQRLHRQFNSIGETK